MAKRSLEELYQRENVQHNLPEKSFFLKAKQDGWEVLRKGWPDFLIYKQGRIAFVEVKPEGEPWLKEQQKIMLSILTEHGLPCYIWTRKSGFKKFKINVPFKR